MTTSDMFGPAPTTPRAERRPLRRSRDGRVAAGVASGLGRYFGVDPVLFRVLFATAAFFGGAGILGYLLAWAAIPEEGTEHAAIDGLFGKLRRKKVPLWLVAVAGGLALWAVSFSWWLPSPVFPVFAAVVLLIVLYARRTLQADEPEAAADGPVNLTKNDPPPGDTGQPPWVPEARGWLTEARAAGLARRQRSLPVRVGLLGTLAAVMGVLAICDALAGIELQVYCWTALGIVVAGLLAGVIARRFPWSMTVLLVPSIVGVIAFAGSHTKLSDGIGQHEWTPTSVPASSYRIAFGQGVLDLRRLAPQSAPRTINVTAGAGQVRILAPKTMNLTVDANLHFGQLDVDHGQGDRSHTYSGVSVDRTVSPPAGATGAAITVDVHLADGNVSVERH